MTLSDLLLKAAGLPINRVIAILSAGAKAVPEFAADAQTIISKLEVAGSLENVARLAVLVPAEAKDILSGKIDPRPDSPSHAA